jgi:uncharacterized protein (DUF2225 family)
MNKAHKYLIDNNLDDIVLNAKEFTENTPDNAKKWIYLSDVLEQYLALKQGQKLTTPVVLKSFTPEQVLEELEDEENIYDARKYFKSLL